MAMQRDSSPAGPVARPASASRDDERRWQAVVDRDASADERFVYAVRTTGVYCRPSCASRAAKRENVSFHAHAADAEAAGFRPCRRCRPDRTVPDAADEAVRRACAMIETEADAPDLATIAARVGYSASHFQRLFKARVGLSPKRYAIARRKARWREALAGSGSATEALFEAGFNGSARAHDARAGLGMTPGAWRRGAAGETIRFAATTSSLGPVLVAATERGICAVELGSTGAPERVLAARFPKARIVPANDELDALVRGVVALIDRPASGHGLPLDVRGTAFQERVWDALTRVPPGETVTYAELAQRIGRPSAARAVARACAANGIAVAVPCHRAVHAAGGRSGYRWGTDRKRVLLQRERASGERVEVDRALAGNEPSAS